MGVVIEVLRASLIGSGLFLLLLLLKAVAGKSFSGGFHYYSRVIPLVFYFGAAIIFTSIIDFISAKSARLAASLPPAIGVSDAPINTVGINVNSISIIREQVTLLTEAASKAINSAELIKYFTVIWAAGVIIFLLYKLISYLRFRKFLFSHSYPYKSLKTGINAKLLICEGIPSPILLGIFKPVIILPKIATDKKELEIILEHELTHIKSGDLVYKLLALIANAIHWFNPLSYLLTRELNQLCERSCDEKLVHNMEVNNRIFYSKMILNTLERGKLFKMQGASASLCDNRKNVEGRIKNIMTFNKMKGKTVAIAVALLVLVACIGVIAAYVLNIKANDMPIADDKISRVTVAESVPEVTPENQIEPNTKTAIDEVVPKKQTESNTDSAIIPKDEEVKLIRPVNYEKISAGYGKRTVGDYTEIHYGIDLKVEHDTDIIASDKGTVSFSGHEGAYGNQVKILHADGKTETMYSHCSKLLVKEGDAVKQGDIIAKVGSTGRSTGNHLDFRVQVDGEYIDPTVFVTAEETSAK